MKMELMTYHSITEISRHRLNSDVIDPISLPTVDSIIISIHSIISITILIIGILLSGRIILL
ncbi:MAG: hypothetical protein Kow00108_05660 [Calditrichia bacterium]